MSYQLFAIRYKEYLKKFGSYLLSSNGAPNFDIEIDYTDELNAIQNVSSAEQLIYLTNALLDQAAIKRCMKEVYKTPSDYYKEHEKFLNDELKRITFSEEEVKKQHESVVSNINRSKNIKIYSRSLQRKLSLLGSKINI